MITLEYGGSRYENWDPAKLVAAGVPQATVDTAVLEQSQSSALSAIDAAAGLARGRYITTAAGQAETYARKLAEAQAFEAANAPASPDPTVYPILIGQAAATDTTVSAVATAVIAADAAWAAAAAKIEAIRVPAKSAVRAATTADAATAAAAAPVQALAQV